MTARTAIQTEMETALEAAADFAGVSCIIEDGTKQNDIETQLRTVGAVLVILPIVKTTPRIQGGGSAMVDATVSVVLAVNPTVNADQTTPLVFENLRAAIAETIIAITAEDNGDRYRLVSDDLMEFDPGLMAATVVFEKGCHVNPV